MSSEARIPSYGEYRAAKGRWEEHRFVAEVLARHTYPLEAQDRETCLSYLMAHGAPPEGFFERLVWRVKKRLGR